MGRFGNITLLICQCNGRAKRVTDAETLQEITHLLTESYKALKESERQLSISDELGDKAIKLCLSMDIDIDDLMKEIVKKVLQDGKIPM